jgi:hypothetical protein
MKLVIQVVTDDDKETAWKFVLTELELFVAAIMYQRLMDLVSTRDNLGCD